MQPDQIIIELESITISIFNQEINFQQMLAHLQVSNQAFPNTQGFLQDPVFNPPGNNRILQQNLNNIGLDLYLDGEGTFIGNGSIFVMNVTSQLFMEKMIGNGRTPYQNETTFLSYLYDLS